MTIETFLSLPLRRMQGREKTPVALHPRRDVTGVSPGAGWQDMNFGRRHVTKWEKIAVVIGKE
jgi:hypothetical protein